LHIFVIVISIILGNRKLQKSSRDNDEVEAEKDRALEKKLTTVKRTDLASPGIKIEKKRCRTAYGCDQKLAENPGHEAEQFLIGMVGDQRCRRPWCLQRDINKCQNQ